MHPEKLLTRLRECAGWSESSPGVHFRRYASWRCGRMKIHQSESESSQLILVLFEIHVNFFLFYVITRTGYLLTRSLIRAKKQSIISPAILVDIRLVISENLIIILPFWFTLWARLLPYVILYRMCLDQQAWANSVDPDETPRERGVSSGSTLFVSHPPTF